MTGSIISLATSGRAFEHETRKLVFETKDISVIISPIKKLFKKLQAFLKPFIYKNNNDFWLILDGAATNSNCTTTHPLQSALHLDSKLQIIVRTFCNCVILPYCANSI